jgi:hypothetical protein
VVSRLSRTKQIWDVNITLMGQIENKIRNKRKLMAPNIKLSHATITLIRLSKKPCKE